MKHYAVEMIDDDNKYYYHVCDSAEDLADFVRINAEEADIFRVSATTLEHLADRHIHEIFDGIPRER